MNGYEKNVAAALSAGIVPELDPSLVESKWVRAWLGAGHSLVARGRPVHVSALETESGFTADGPLHDLPHPDVLEDSIRAIEEAGIERRVREAARNPARGWSLVDHVLAAAVAPERTRGRQFADILSSEAKRLKEGKQRARYLPTGLHTLDATLGGGLPRGVVTVVGARPGVGKSSFCLSLGREACRQMAGVHFISLEDPAWRFAYRYAAAVTGVPVSVVPSTGLSVTPPQRWVVDDSPGHTARSVCRAVKQEASRNGTSLIVVDYAQLLRGEDQRAPEHVKLAEAMAEFVVLARGLDAVVVVVSQINRNAVATGRATMADLKSSGAFEECAKVVLLLDRPNHGTGDDSVLDVNIAKNNFGEAGVSVQLGWDGATCRVW